MAYRNPLHHLLHSLLPSRHPAETPQEFADTRPDDSADADTLETRRAASDRTPPSQRRPSTTAWAESSIELAQGTEIMEFPEDTAADLMDEYFAQPKKRAA